MSLFNNKLQKVQMAMLAQDVQDRFTNNETQLAQMGQQKADTTYVDTKFAGAVNGSPIPVTLASQMTDHTRNYVYLGSESGYTLGNIYYWNGSTFTNSGKQYQSTGIADSSLTSQMYGDGTITPKKLSQITTGKNLFNKYAATSGYYVDDTTGNLVASASYCVSDYVPVLPNTTYTRTFNNRAAFYDSNRNYISGLANGSALTFTTPANCYYMRVSVVPDSNPTVGANLSTYQLELGSVSTPYEAYNFSFNQLKVPNSNLVSVSKDKLTFNVAELKTGKNLFNKDTVTAGYYVDNTTGNLVSNSAYNTSDWIPVSPNTQYTYSTNNRIVFYDANKNYISGSNAVNTVTSPSNASYARLAVPNSVINTAQFEIGSTSTSYESFKYNINNLSVNSDFLLFLPSEICIAVGRTIELYNKQVAWCGNIDNYHFKWDCSIGRAMKRKWTFTGVASKLGSYTLTCTVYDNNMHLVATASTTVKVVSNTITTAKKILPIGDSLTNGKAWLGEVRNLSGNQLSFVGTRWSGDVQGGNLNHEGRSGFTSSNYLANTPYTFDTNGVGSENPFWNPSTSQFDFAYYKSHYSITPDIIQIYLGTNGIATDPTQNVSGIKGIVDGIRSNDANIPIYVVFTLYRGDQNGIGNQLSTDGYSAGSGVWKLEEDRKVYNLMVALYAALNAYTNLYFIPISLTHDSEYNFKSNTATPVNPRSSITEVVDAEATHPSPRNDGYYQMADIMFSTFAAHIN